MSKSIIKCMQYDLFNLVPVTGQYYFCTDTRTLFKDNGATKDSRIRFNAQILNTEYERLNAIKPTIGKFYYVIETNQLWLFDTRWNLKIGTPDVYNSYITSYSNIYAGDYISPVINTDTTITGPTGDKIIDNNGLLGNGSVGIRDSNRLIKGLIEVNNLNQQLTFHSYLDNGFLFIPNSHLPYTDLSTSLGALHLTVDRDINNSDDNLELTGQAYYYGEWNNYGDMFIINKIKNDLTIGLDYTPNVDKTLVKIFLTCTKTEIEDDKEVKIKTHIIIRPISTTQGIANIVSIDANDEGAIVQNDIGELICTSASVLKESKTINCTRKISYSNGYTYCTYTFDGYDSNDKIILQENSNTKIATIPKIWSTDGSADEFYISVWNKKKVLTDEDFDIPTSISEQYIKRVDY